MSPASNQKRCRETNNSIYSLSQLRVQSTNNEVAAVTMADYKNFCLRIKLVKSLRYFFRSKEPLSRVRIEFLPDHPKRMRRARLFKREFKADRKTEFGAVHGAYRAHVPCTSTIQKLRV